MKTWNMVLNSRGALKKFVLGVAAGAVGFWGLGLTALAADYSTAVTSLNPVGYWRLNEPAASATAVNMGSAGASGNATYIASPALQQPGAMGTDPAALFNGAGQYASVPYNTAFNPSGSFTVGFWANKTAPGASTVGAIFSRDPASSGQNGWLFFANNGNDQKWWFRTYTGNVRANAISSNPILLNQWTHVVGVHDATDTGTNYLYVNGVLATAPVGNAGYTPNASFPMFFAAWANTGTELPEYFFPGLLDEIAFFDKALTPAQIHDLYVAAEYPPRIVEQPSAPGKIYEGDPTPLTLSVVVDNVSATPATYQWTKDGNNIPGATTASLALGVVTVGTSGNYAVVVSNPNGSVTSVVVPISVVTSPPGRVDYASRVKSFNPVAYYRLNDAATATTTANAGSWGAGANGAYKPGATGGAPGVPYPGFGAGNYGTLFGGIAGLRDGAVGDPDTPGSCIRIPAQSGTVENMTITCWVKRNGDHWVWRGLVTQRDGDSGAPNGAGYGTGLTLGSGGSSPDVGQELRILWNKGDVYWQYDPGLNTPNQQWAFCAVVFTPTNRTVYLNTHAVERTVPETESTMPAGPHDWSVNPIFIGYDARGPYYGENSAFNGAMDEVAIFDRALTADEMMQLYAAAEVPPIILVQPQAPPPPVYEGTTLSLSVQCDEYASSSPLHYQWTKNGVPMPGQTTAELVFSSLVTGDTGDYAVVVTNAFGEVTSAVVALTVLSGPPIIAQPPESVVRYAGGTASFTVAAAGSGPLSYQWSLDGTPISGATSSAYTVFDVRTGDAGTYSVLITNPYGTATATATLTLITATKLAAVVTERTPFGYWRMDETSGTVAYDYFSGRNGTLRTGVTNNVPGPEPTAFQGFDTGNKAYALNGTGGYVTAPSFGQIAGAMTIIAWIKPDAVQPDWAGLVYTRGGGGSTSGLQFTQGGQLGYNWNDAAASYNWQSGMYPVADQWNFVALVVEPKQATLYLDSGGGMWSSVNTLNHGTATWSGVRFGSDPQGGRDYKGGLDDVAVYAYALPPDEIENIRKAGVEGIYTPAKVFRWKGASGAGWSVAGNWNDTVPGLADIAVFSDSSSAGATVNLGTDVTVGGLRFNNRVANQTIASTGGKTLALSGGGVEVQAGTLSISSPIDATANGLSKSGSGVLNIAGPMQVTYQPPNAWTFHQVSGIELSGNGSWTVANDFPVMDVVGTVTVNDNATIDWSSSVSGIALRDGETGVLVQNGGLVKGKPVGEGWGCCAGPGFILGSKPDYWGGTGPSDAQYVLNGGVLLVASVYNINGAWDDPPSPPNGSAVFRFNGGILRATQADSTDAGAIKEACTNLMGNLSHAYVGLGGAKIDVASFGCGINQALEHDPALGNTPDGGLRAMSTGGPGTLALYKLSTFTGPLAIDANVKVELGYTGDQRVASVSIGGVDQGVGTFGVGHLNPGGVFTGTGTVTVQPPAPPTPTLPASSFSIAAGVPTFTNVPTTAGYTYWLTYKNSLRDAAWTRIGAGTAGGGNKTFTDTATPYPAYRFYRLEVQ